MGKFEKTCCSLSKRLRKRFRRHGSTIQIGPLSERCKAGRVKICKVMGDRKLCSKMAAMGLIPGSEAELLCADSSSQCIIRVHGGTVCLDRTIAENILVTEG